MIKIDHIKITTCTDPYTNIIVHNKFHLSFIEFQSNKNVTRNTEVTMILDSVEEICEWLKLNYRPF